MHMIERMTGQTFGYDKKHLKNDLKTPVDDRRTVAPRASPHRDTRGRGQPQDKPLSPI
jgi:hypothetical protein